MHINLITIKKVPLLEIYCKKTTNKGTFMNNLSEIIISVYLTIEKELSNLLQGKVLRKSGKVPKLTDGECITIFVVAEALNINTEVGTWKYFKEHWSHYFPSLPSRSQLHRQITNLWNICQHIQQRLLRQHFSQPERCIIDGFPIRVCRFSRARRVSRFRDVSSYDHCAAQKETYFGMKGHLLINDQGCIVNCLIANAKYKERESSFEVLEGYRGICLGDKGYLGKDFWEEMRNSGVIFRTPFRKNMESDPMREMTKDERTSRRLIETVIEQLTERFGLKRLWCRDVFHLTGRVARKILSHTICCVLNKTLGNKTTQFEKIIPML